MKKLTLAFTLLSSVAFAGTALADHDQPVAGDDQRVLVVDRRAPIADSRGPFADHRGPIADDRTFADTRGQMIDHRMIAPPVVQPRWELITTERAPARRGILSIALPRMGSYDQLRLIASDRGLDIMAVELTYGRGRTVLVRPQADGLVTLDLGRGKLRSISVRYVNRGAGRGGRGPEYGAGRGATIQVLAKDQTPVVIGQRDDRPGRRY